MELLKLEVIEKMKEKGMTPAQVAKAIGFDPDILSLYLVEDAYPVPKRILNKASEALSK